MSHWLRFVISELNKLIIGLITYFMTVSMCGFSSIMLSTLDGTSGIVIDQLNFRPQVSQLLLLSLVQDYG